MTETKAVANSQSDQDFEQLLASAMADLESSEPALDELDRQNRDEYAYAPDVESFYFAYKTSLKPSTEGSSPEANTDQ